MENEVFKKKIRCAAGISSLILSIYILVPLYICGKNFLAGFVDGFNSTETTGNASILEGIIVLAIAIAGICVIVNSVRLLLGIRKNETPFTDKNGKRIRQIGIMLMLLEPLMLLSQWISGEPFFEISGITFCAGLILVNVSLLFRYGAHLQQESDETL